MVRGSSATLKSFHPGIQIGGPVTLPKRIGRPFGMKPVTSARGATELLRRLQLLREIHALKQIAKTGVRSQRSKAGINLQKLQRTITLVVSGVQPLECLILILEPCFDESDCIWRKLTFL